MKRLDLVGERDLPVTIGRYTLTGILGEGGMARVFRAKMEGALGFRKPAAVKVVLPAAGERGQSLRQQLIQEARLGGLLNHPNVVQTFDCGELEGFPYIAMELVEGPGLDDLVNEVGPLPIGAALDIAIQVARGLHHAHAATHEGEPLAIIHRDVKPSNVLIREDGVVKVMDFGIAKVAMEDALSTATGMTKGTPSYMSPEQLAGDALDLRSDLFALGALIHYMISGKTLFTGSSLTEVLLRIISVDETVKSQSVLTDADALIPGLGAVLARLLVKNRDDRYPSADLLERDLVALRRRASDEERVLARLVEMHFSGVLATARDKASAVTGPSGLRAQVSDEVRAAAAEEGSPGPTRSFLAEGMGSVPATDSPGVRPTVAMIPTQRARRNAPPPGEPPLGTQTRPGFRSADPDQATRAVPTSGPGKRARKGTRAQGTPTALLLGLGAVAGVLVVVIGLLLLERDEHRTEETPPHQATVAPESEVARGLRVDQERRDLERAQATEAERAREAERRRQAASRVPAPVAEPRTEPPVPTVVAAPTPAPAPTPEVAEADPDRRRAFEERRRGHSEDGAKGAEEPATRAPKGTPRETPTPAVAAAEGPPRLAATHVPVRRATMGTTKPIVVTIEGPDDTRVTMFWGPKGGPHASVELQAQGSGVWRGSLTIDAAASAGLEYWIVVKHHEATPRVIALGRQSAPYEVAVY